MSLVLYASAGSPSAWKVWLALEHKAVPYVLHEVSLSTSDQKKPEFLAINPRGKVPAIVDDEVTLYESSAIAEYIEERWPEPTLLPGDVNQRSQLRRMCIEAQLYLEGALEKIIDHTLYAAEQPGGTGDPAVIAAAREEMVREVAYWDRSIGEPFVAGPISLADFTLYPLLALARRLAARLPQLELGDLVTPRIGAWMKRVEALPYFERTYPPHWRSDS